MKRYTRDTIIFMSMILWFLSMMLNKACLRCPFLNVQNNSKRLIISDTTFYAMPTFHWSLLDLSILECPIRLRTSLLIPLYFPITVSCIVLLQSHEAALLTVENVPRVRDLQTVESPWTSGPVGTAGLRALVRTKGWRPGTMLATTVAKGSWKHILRWMFVGVMIFLRKGKKRGFVTSAGAVVIYWAIIYC